MFRAVNNFVLNKTPFWIWFVLGAAFVAFALNYMGWLEGQYNATGFPVTFVESQTTFNADTSKGYYAVLQEKGTLDDYIRVQILDYALIVSFIGSLFCMGASAARLLTMAFGAKWLTNITLFMMWMLPLGGVFDAIENAISFVMLSDPQGFADWLVYPYSSFAVAKFITITTGLGWTVLTHGIFIVLGLPVLAFNKLRGK